MEGIPLLTLIVLVPAISGLVVLLVPKRLPDVAKIVGLCGSVITAALTVSLLADFDKDAGGFQFVTMHTWIEPLGVSWHLGVDGISLFLVVLTGLIVPLALLGADAHKDYRAYTAWMLLLEAGLLGAFLSLDLLLFFVFFEVVLVPMYFLIGGWGYADRVHAAVKFFLYTMAGSAFMLVGIAATAYFHYSASGNLTFDLVEIAQSQDIATSTARWLFLAFAIAFAVKVPVFPLHTWLPDAHTQAPTAGSVILAAVMLKLGTYGLLRFGLYLFPEASDYFAPLLMTLGVIGVLYGAIVATMQRDLKRLVAYSSVAHLGFIVLGTFAITSQSVTGGVMQMVNHGVSTGALFLLVGMIYERRHTREIKDLNGLQHVAPVFAAVFTIVMFSSIAVPGLNGFVGEFLILIGSFLTARWWTVAAAVGVIFAALYLLWAYQRVFHGTPSEENRSFRELSLREGLIMLPLLAAIFAVGIYPKPMLDRIQPSVERLVEHVEAYSGHTAPTVGEAGERLMTSVLAQATTFQGPEIQWFALSPLLVMTVGGLVLMVLAALGPRRLPKGVLAFATCTIAGAAFVLSWFNWADVQDGETKGLVGSALGLDGFSVFFTIVITAAVFLIALLADDYLRRIDADGVEFYALLLMAGAGAIVLASANDLVVLFLGLETMSLGLYVLAAFNRHSMRSTEAAVKYFVLGSFASAVFLYGIALVYGATGSTGLPAISRFLSANVVLDDGMLLAGLALLIVGFAFKVGAVPFQWWLPDVYQGSPSPVTGLMASAAKVGAFAALMRVLMVTFGPYETDWQPAIYALAVLSLVVGAVLAVVQTNVKRMLAYSSISHAGFILVGVELADDSGMSAALFYLLTYAILVAGTFGVVALVGRARGGNQSLAAYRGLSKVRPGLALVLMVFLLAQAGIPLTSGFWAKFGVIQAAADQEQWALALIAMLASVVAAFLYLRVIVSMYLAEPEPIAAGNLVDSTRPVRVPVSAALAIGLSLAFTLAVGFLPGRVIDFARDAVPVLAVGG